MPKNTTTIERALTKKVQPVANQLIARCGSLKRVLSAGVLALDKLNADEREELLVLATETTSENNTRKTLRDAISVIKKSAKIEQDSPGTIIEFLNEDEKAVLDEFRKLIGPEKQQTAKKKKG